ncbi:MAG TPA: GHKL domain-containing protein [Candidatus Pelethocola excrementipullorum]|nr:GHKL domain-containing protein [Candidatus Pelethocola excrementipullorum]
MHYMLPGIEFFSSFLEVYLCYRILELLFINEYRSTRREIWFQEVVIVGYSLLLTVFIRYNDKVLLFSDYLVFKVIVVVFLTSVWLYSVNKLAVLAVVSFYFMSLAFLDVLGIVIMSRVLENAQFAVQLSGGMFRIGFVAVIDMVWLLLYLLLLYYRRGKCKNGVARYWRWILGASVLGFGAIYYLQTVAFLNITENLGLISMTFLLVFYIFFASANIYKKYRDKKEENQLIEVQKYYLESNMADMQELYDSSSRNYHDIKNHLNAIYQMVRAKKNDEAMEYIEQIGEPFRKLDRKVWTGNSMMDMIINCNVTECEKQKIRLEIDADTIPLLPMENQDICTVLSNLFDNAIEACEKLRTGEGKILIKIQQKNSMMLLHMRNTMAVKPEVRKGRLKTHKSKRSFHGLGIENIRRAVEKYDGFYEFHYDDKWFETTITLPL